MSVSNEIGELFNFIQQSPTAWHAVETASKSLIKAGFQALSEEENWSISAGGKYFVTRNGSSLCAFVIPNTPPQKALILAAHTDSPALKLKPNSEYRIHNQIMWGVEPYGAPLLNSWLNRDLGLAGRVVCEDSSGQLTQCLINYVKAPCFIPQLAIHLDREINEKGLLLNRQEHFAAIASLSSDLPTETNYLDKILIQECHCNPLAADLFLYPLDPPRLCGKEGQMISSYRLDNLASMHAALLSMLKFPASLSQTIKMAIFWDNEEIGSKTAQGADSSFLNDILQRIVINLDLHGDDFFKIKGQSLCISIDLAHAMHPNYLLKHEPRHPIYLDNGVVIKMNANQRYATDALTAGMIVAKCQSLKIPYQKFSARSDIACGSTVGPITASQTGIKTVDIGCAQLSMHSAREVISCKDYLSMCRLLDALTEKEAQKKER